MLVVDMIIFAKTNAKEWVAWKWCTNVLEETVGCARRKLEQPNHDKTTIVQVFTYGKRLPLFPVTSLPASAKNFAEIFNAGHVRNFSFYRGVATL